MSTRLNCTTQPDGDYTHPVGALVEIWDKDDTSDDEYIGTWILVNLWDYHINSQAWWSNLDETRQTLLGHNCLGTQDTN